MALPQFVDEVLNPVVGFPDSSPLYNVVNGETGDILHTNVKIILQNSTQTEGTPASAEVLNRLVDLLNTVVVGENNVVPIEHGGLGTTSAAAARNALGLGNTTNALPVENGGTNATTAAAARASLQITPLNIGAATYRTYSVSIPAAGWSSTAPFTQTKTITGLLATDTPVIDVILSDTAATAANQLNAYQMVGRVKVTEANTIQLFCYDEKPTVDFTIQMVVTRNG